jgi:hypothetical protein
MSFLGALLCKCCERIQCSLPLLIACMSLMHRSKSVRDMNCCRCPKVRLPLLFQDSHPKPHQTVNLLIQIL